MPICSIFATQEEASAWAKAHGQHRPKRPLAENTLRRVAAGIKRYVLDSPQPFLVATNHGDSGGRRTYPLDEPMRTVTASCRGGEAICVPTLVQVGEARVGGERAGTARLAGHGGLVAAFMAKHYTGAVGCRLDQPAPTQTCRGTQNQLVMAQLTHLYGSNRGGGGDLREPLGTITAGGNHAALVAALLIKYYGTADGGYGVDGPLHTIPTRDRYGLVLVQIDGATYVIEDIGMRMLRPRELYRAQGFGEDYVIDYGLDEQDRMVELTKTDQVRMCGNSVAPPVAEALVRANVRANVGGVGFEGGGGF